MSDFLWRALDTIPWLLGAGVIFSEDEAAASESAETSKMDADDGTSQRECASKLRLFDVSRDPPNPHACHRPATSRRRAYEVPLNAQTGTPFSNDDFDGAILVLYKFEGEDHVHKHYFANKTRLWEVRIQGRFKRKPPGKLWAGIVLHDFDYRTPMTYTGNLLATFIVPIMQMTIGQRIYFARGDRGEASELPEEPELLHVVGRLPAIDQIIVTPPSATPPKLGEDLSGLGAMRNQMGTYEYIKEVESIEASFNTQDTYTFSIWGMSRFYDMVEGIVTNVVPWVSVGTNEFFSGLPPHAVLYSLTDEQNQGTQRHLESQKQYIFDVMIRASAADSCRSLGIATPEKRYIFEDTKVSVDRRLETSAIEAASTPRKDLNGGIAKRSLINFDHLSCWCSGQCFAWMTACVQLFKKKRSPVLTV